MSPATGANTKIFSGILFHTVSISAALLMVWTNATASTQCAW